MVVSTYADGPTLICNAPFVYEGGEWRRRFGQKKYDPLMQASASESW